MTSPLESSTRRGWTGLKACSGGMGILVQGRPGAGVAGDLAADDLAAGASWACATRIAGARREAVRASASRVRAGVFIVGVEVLLVMEIFTGHLPVRLQRVA